MSEMSDHREWREYSADDYRAWADWLDDQSMQAQAPYEHGPFPDSTLVLRAHAALIEQHERLKKHADRIADSYEAYASEGNGMTPRCVAEYREDFPSNSSRQDQGRPSTPHCINSTKEGGPVSENTPTPSIKRLRAGIEVNGINGETRPVYAEYVLLEDYRQLERDLAAAKEALAELHRGKVLADGMANTVRGFILKRAERETLDEVAAAYRRWEEDYCHRNFRKPKP